MAAYGTDWRTNPVAQIKWGLDYIENRLRLPLLRLGPLPGQGLVLTSHFPYVRRSVGYRPRIFGRKGWGKMCAWGDCAGEQ